MACAVPPRPLRRRRWSTARPRRAGTVSTSCATVDARIPPNPAVCCARGCRRRFRRRRVTVGSAAGDMLLALRRRRARAAGQAACAAMVEQARRFLLFRRAGRCRAAAPGARRRPPRPPVQRTWCAPDRRGTPGSRQVAIFRGKGFRRKSPASHAPLQRAEAQASGGFTYLWNAERSADARPRDRARGVRRGGPPRRRGRLVRRLARALSILYSEERLVWGRAL